VNLHKYFYFVLLFSSEETKPTYCDKLAKIKELVNRKEQPTVEEITKGLGKLIYI